MVRAWRSNTTGHRREGRRPRWRVASLKGSPCSSEGKLRNNEVEPQHVWPDGQENGFCVS
jgi:hypothetical protein